MFFKYILQLRAPTIFIKFCQRSKNRLIPATSYRDRIPISQTWYGTVAQANHNIGNCPFLLKLLFLAIKNLHKISPCIYILVLLEEIDNISSLTDQMSIYDHQFSRYIGAYIITFLNVNGENSVAKPGKI